MTRKSSKGIPNPKQPNKVPIPATTEMSYLLSFLAILVDQAGGQIAIEGLSKYAGNRTGLRYDLDAENDRVVISAKVEPDPDPAPAIMKTAVFMRRDQKKQ